MIDWEPEPEPEENGQSLKNDNDEENDGNDDEDDQEDQKYEEDPFDNWNPMEQHSNSIANNSTINCSNPCLESLQPKSELSCPYQKKPWTVCFKGRTCPYFHGQYTPKMKMGNNNNIL
jgi:hypothetical protein